MHRLKDKRLIQLSLQDGPHDSLFSFSVAIYIHSLSTLLETPVPTYSGKSSLCFSAIAM